MQNYLKILPQMSSFGLIGEIFLSFTKNSHASNFVTDPHDSEKSEVL